MKKTKEIFKLIRIKHYIKNFLVFIPLIFSGELLIGTKARLSLFGFLTFCCICSVVYIINDLKDYDYDRLHPVKRNRPLASNSISRYVAVLTVGVLLILFIVGSYVIYSKGARSLISIMAVPLLYLIINIGYSFGLKNVPILDVAILASGFVMRVFYGGLIINITISSWVYLTIIAGSLYLGLGKRKAELDSSGNAVRKALSGYSSDFLAKNMYMCLGLCLVFYALACTDLNTKVAQMGGNLLWTVPLVMLIGLKYNQIIENNDDGDPTSIILGGGYFLQGMIISLIVGVIFTIY